MSVLKHTDLIGAVNNDIVSADPCPRAITISDVWDIAVMGYTFPLFTRRYPWEGIENFAFDALLGKPAIAVIHHDYCSDHGARLVNFVKQVNALQCAPTWRNLGDVVRRSCRQREDSPARVEVEMYGTELRIENRSGQPKRFLIRRRECEPSAIQRICTDAQEIAWRQVDGRINFEIELKPGESRVIKIKFHDFVGKERNGDNLPYRFKTMLRRYLCEMRDNYVAPMTMQVRWVALDRRNVNRNSVGITLRQNTPSIDHAEFNKVRIQMQAAKTSDPLAARVSDVLTDFVEWLDRYGEKSWDYQSFFAGPVGGRAKALYYRHRLIGTAAVAPMIFCEAFLPSARRLFHHPMRFPIADAHYAMGFAFLYQATGDSSQLENAVHFLTELEKSRCGQFKEYCWGYPFDWVWRGRNDQAADAADHHDALRVRSVPSGFQRAPTRRVETDPRIDCAPRRYRHQGFPNIGNGQQLFLHSFR